MRAHCLLRTVGAKPTCRGCGLDSRGLCPNPARTVAPSGMSAHSAQNRGRPWRTGFRKEGGPSTGQARGHGSRDRMWRPALGQCPALEPQGGDLQTREASARHACRRISVSPRPGRAEPGICQKRDPKSSRPEGATLDQAIGRQRQAVKARALAETHLKDTREALLRAEAAVQHATEAEQAATQEVQRIRLLIAESESSPEIRVPAPAQISSQVFADLLRFLAGSGLYSRSAGSGRHRTEVPSSPCTTSGVGCPCSGGPCGTTCVATPGLSSRRSFPSWTALAQRSISGTQAPAPTKGRIVGLCADAPDEHCFCSSHPKITAKCITHPRPRRWTGQEPEPISGIPSKRGALSHTASFLAISPLGFAEQPSGCSPWPWSLLNARAAAVVLGGRALWCLWLCWTLCVARQKKGFLPKLWTGMPRNGPPTRICRIWSKQPHRKMYPLPSALTMTLALACLSVGCMTGTVPLLGVHGQHLSLTTRHARAALAPDIPVPLNRTRCLTDQSLEPLQPFSDGSKLDNGPLYQRSLLPCTDLLLWPSSGRCSGPLVTSMDSSDTRQQKHMESYMCACEGVDHLPLAMRQTQQQHRVQAGTQPSTSPIRPLAEHRSRHSGPMRPLVETQHSGPIRPLAETHHFAATTLRLLSGHWRQTSCTLSPISRNNSSSHSSATLGLSSHFACSSVPTLSSSSIAAAAAAALDSQRSGLSNRPQPLSGSNPVHVQLLSGHFLAGQPSSGPPPLQRAQLAAQEPPRTDARTHPSHAS